MSSILHIVCLRLGRSRVDLGSIWGSLGRSLLDPGSIRPLLLIYSVYKTFRYVSLLSHGGIRHCTWRIAYIYYWVRYGVHWVDLGLICARSDHFCWCTPYTNRSRYSFFLMEYASCKLFLWLHICYGMTCGHSREFSQPVSRAHCIHSNLKVRG